MTKFVFLASILSLILNQSAFAAEQFECVKTSDGAEVKLGSKTLGFSSVAQCNDQVEYLATSPADAVICGCNANSVPGGALLTLMGAMMGIQQTFMILECFKLEGTELTQVHTKNYEVIREINLTNKNGKTITVNKEKIEACKKEERRLFVELNNMSSVAESRY